jgi:hypothetical protein
MVLAWRTRGNSYQHWVFYVCDFEKGIVRSDKTKHDHDPLGLAFYYNRFCGEYNSLRRLKKLAIPDSHPFDRSLITNGKVTGLYSKGFYYRGLEYEVPFDIRFEPVAVDYLTGGVIGGKRISDSNFDRYHELWKTARSTLDKLADDRFPGNGEYKITGELKKLALCIEFNKIFDAMEPSQFKVEINRHAWGFKKPSSLSGFILNHLKNNARHNEVDFDQLMKAFCLDTVTELRPIKKCLERRIRRYPAASKGTVNLLKMLNASRSILTFTQNIKSAKSA